MGHHELNRISITTGRATSVASTDAPRAVGRYPGTMTAIGAAHPPRTRRIPLNVRAKREVDAESYAPVPLEPVRPESDLVEGPKRWILTTKHHIEEHCDDVEGRHTWSPEPACEAPEHAREVPA